MLPNNLRPYWHLCRLDKPTGTFLLLLPCWWGLALTGSTTGKWYALFAVGALIMRSAGCVINDVWDRDIDKKVERTKTRPLASGAVSVKGALILLGLLLTAGLIVLLQFPTKTIVLGIASLPLVAIYPLMKRFFPIPQLFLGLVFNWGVLMGYQVVTGSITAEAVGLYLAAIFWTLAYDTIYALQDVEDDRKLGVKSSALFFGKSAQPAIVTCYFIMAAMFFYINLLLPFVVILLFSVYYSFQNLRPGLFKKNEYFKLFNINAYVGFILFISILMEQT